MGETLESVRTLVGQGKKKKEDGEGGAVEANDSDAEEGDNSVDLDESTMPVLLPRTPGKRKAAAMAAEAKKTTTRTTRRTTTVTAAA